MRRDTPAGMRVAGQVLLAALLVWFAVSQLLFGLRANRAYAAPASQLQGVVLGRVVDTATLPLLGKDTVEIQVPDTQLRVRVIPLSEGGVEAGEPRTIRFDLDDPRTARYEAASTGRRPGWKFIAAGTAAAIVAAILLVAAFRNRNLWPGAGMSDRDLLRVKFTGHRRHGGA